MPRSAGVLLYRRDRGALEVLLVHPGGPFWARRDEGAWTVPKGLVEPGEGEEAAAFRELREETGWGVEGPRLALGEIRQKGGKVVVCWAAEAHVDPATLIPDEIEIEWPPRSGRRMRIPEVDRAAWFGLEEGARRINVAQRALLTRLRDRLG